MQRLAAVLIQLCPDRRLSTVWTGASRWPEGEGCRLRGIDIQDRGGLLQAVIHGSQHALHGVQRIVLKQRAHLFPKPALTSPLAPRRLEQRTTYLLNLIE